MAALHSQKPVEVETPAPLSLASFGFLNHLRFTAMECRSKPRTDLFEACALLHVCHDASRQAYAEALMRCLGEALGKPAKVLAPGVAEQTFDEKWLVELGAAYSRGDQPSFQFLIKSRVAREHQRLVQFLITQISDRFAQV